MFFRHQDQSNSECLRLGEILFPCGRESTDYCHLVFISAVMLVDRVELSYFFEASFFAQHALLASCKARDHHSCQS